MRRRSRLLRVAKWGVVVAAVVLIVAGVVNLRYTVMYSLPDGSGCGVENGMVGVSWRGLNVSGPGIEIDDTGEWEFWPPFYFRAGGGSAVLAAPIWLPLLAISIPTSILWYLDRRRRPKPGHCPCGYDLTGNESGVCPECGRACASPSDSR